MRQDMRHIGDRVEALESQQAQIMDHQRATSNAFQKYGSYLNQMQNALEDQENRGRRNNLRIRGIPEAVLPGDIPAAVISLCSSLLGPEFALEIVLERAHRALRPKPKAEDPPRDVICKFLNFQVKSAVQDAARNRQDILFEGSQISIYQDLAPSTLRKRKCLKPLTEWLKANRILYKWNVPFGLSFLQGSRRMNITTFADLEAVYDHLQIPPMQIENWDLFQDLGALPEVPAVEAFTLQHTPKNHKAGKRGRQLTPKRLSQD